MSDESPKQAAGSGSGTIGSESFRRLSQEILLCSSSIRPSVDFLIELSGILLAFSRCEELELWLKERGKCSRWRAVDKPRRFLKLEDVTCEELESRIERRLEFDINGERKGEGDAGEPASVLSVPLIAGDETIGLMLLKRKERWSRSDELSQLYQYISQTVAIAVAYHRVQLEQRERVKELTCLYEIARAGTLQSKRIEEVLSSIVGHLPPAWQYPEIAAARLMLDEMQFTAGWEEGIRHSQKADISVDGQIRGFVEVGYTEDKPELDEGPFLFEERRLIDTIAREVAAIVERRRMEEERFKLQEQLRHADRLATIGQLAAGVAHELNEPLGGILGFSQLAGKHPALPGEVGKDLARIESASLHAREVIKKLMLFARQTPPSKNKVNLNKIVEDGLFFLQSRCAKVGIELICDVSADLPEIVADAAQIHQVLVNLVVNGIQAMKSGGRLTVRTFAEEDYVTLSVEDSGCGMNREIQKKIFVPFFTTKDVGEGTGLGLPVVHGIVTSHGGTIDVESRPGRGTRFLVRLPTEVSEGIDSDE